MPTLSDKLKALGVRRGARDLPPPRPLSAAYAIEEVVSGHVQPTSYGDVFVVETSYDPTYKHGQVGLWAEAPLGTIAAWAREPAVAGGNLERFAFLDTETSGLAGGTGTYTFMIGVGRFDKGHFRLAQFFLRDPGQERAQLEALMQFLEPCEVLVTFNGKSFDAPLLNARFTLNDQRSPLIDLAHLDLLPLARRLWRDRLPSRRLGDLEAQILRADRTEEDIPGWLIPSVYFDYLRSGDARPLKGVFYHNAMDVLAMAALLNHISQMPAEPLGPTVEYALDLIAIGKLHEALDQPDIAVQLFEQGMDRDDLPEEHYWATQRRLSFLQKRNNNMAAAVAVWQLAAEGRQIYAHVELAKFYEHKRRDYREAIRWTLAALDLLEAAHRSRADRHRWTGELKHRLVRLQRKLERSA